MNEQTEQLTPIKRLTRDQVNAAKNISRREVRYLVDYYYICQEDRKRAKSQVRALEQFGEPNELVQYLADQAEVLESQVKRMLDKYVEKDPVASWISDLYGFGPVLSAGFVAHLDITMAPTAGHFWAFAGLDPTKTWEKGKKRPWNAKLRVLSWKAGQCMMKFSNREDCYYGQIYKKAKEYYFQKNEAGDYSAQAKSELVSGKYKERIVKASSQDGEEVTEETFKRAKFYLEQGKLPPAHIDARARRYAVKMFLSHLHEVWYKFHYKTNPPRPFALEILGHAHKIEPPSQIIV